MELYPIALAGLLWGPLWRGRKLLFHCNNQSVMVIWAKSSSCCPLLRHLVHSIFFCAASHQFSVLVSVIRGTDNQIADALSRFQMFRFRQLTDYASLSADLLAGRLAFLQSQTIAPSTRCTYYAGIRRYTTFCCSRQWNPFPASELQLCYFASWRSDQVSFPTIKLYLTGIRFATSKTALQTRLQMPPSLFTSTRHQADNWTLLPPSTYHHVSQ